MQNVTVLQRLSGSVQIQKEEHIGPLFIRSFVFISSSAVFAPHSEFLLVYRVMPKSADATDRIPHTQSSVTSVFVFHQQVVLSAVSANWAKILVLVV